MSVRPAKPGEVGSILILWKGLANDPDGMDKPIPTTERNLRSMSEFISRLIEEDPRQVLVAEKDGELVGCLMFQRVVKTPIERDYKWANVSDFYVKPSYRRQGIGKKLLQACMDDLRRSGTTHVTVRVWSRNEKAIRLYREAGFGDHTLTLEAELARKAR